jgi:3-hydroxyisobutyrate dehydrogenase-like beta-hydroxyacid dehydrogenase
VDALVARGAERATRPSDALATGGIVMTLLWDDTSVESIVTSEDFLARLGKDGVHVSMSTLSPAGSKALAALHTRYGSHFVEAPIFGRPEAAVARSLWGPIAGLAAAKARVRPLLEAMGAKGVFDFGEEVGAATIVKLVGNFLIVSAGASLSEGLSLAMKSGLDPKAVIDMLTQTLFPAPIYRTYGRMIAEGTSTIGQSPIPAEANADISIWVSQCAFAVLATAANRCAAHASGFMRVLREVQVYNSTLATAGCCEDTPAWIIAR